MRHAADRSFALTFALPATTTSKKYVRGKTWTTDGLYRETRARINRRGREGCVVVEMEAAAFSRARDTAASSARRFSTEATVSRDADGIGVPGINTRVRERLFFSRRRGVPAALRQLRGYPTLRADDRHEAHGEPAARPARQCIPLEVGCAQ